MEAVKEQKQEKTALEFWREWKYVIILIAVLIGTLVYKGVTAYATGYPFRSKGRIVYDNETPDDKSDDIVIFDARDFEYLYDLALEPYNPTP